MTSTTPTPAEGALTDERIGQIWADVAEHEHDDVNWDTVLAFARHVIAALSTPTGQAPAPVPEPVVEVVYDGFPRNTYRAKWLKHPRHLVGMKLYALSTPAGQAPAPAVTEAMVTAYLQANDAYWKRTDELPTPPDKWRTGTPREATRVSLEAALATPQPAQQPPWDELLRQRNDLALLVARLARRLRTDGLSAAGNRNLSDQAVIYLRRKGLSSPLRAAAQPAQAPAPAQEPDMRAICEALGFDPTNHHNAAKCPYCRPEQPAQEPAPAAAAPKSKPRKLTLGKVRANLEGLSKDQLLSIATVLVCEAQEPADAVPLAVIGSGGRTRTQVIADGDGALFGLQEPAEDAAYPACAYRVDADTRIEEAQQMEGPSKWAIRRYGSVLGKDGQWEYEPMPSSRDDEFLARCRFDTLREAIDAARQEQQPSGGKV